MYVHILCTTFSVIKAAFKASVFGYIYGETIDAVDEPTLRAMQLPCAPMHVKADVVASRFRSL